MPSYKLQYFNARGRAEVPRLMFAAADKSYEDDRFEFDQWAERKPKTPFGQVPVLEIDGSPLSQSGAIVRYLAREFGLAGENSLQQAYSDMIFETVSEAFFKLPLFEKDEAEKAKKMKECLENTIKPMFERFEKKFSEKVAECKEKKTLDKLFFIGSKLTIADIVVFHYGSIIEELNEGFLNQFPNVRDYIVKKTAANERIKAYLAKRPKTSF